jgi:hypothetical protein
MKKTPAEQRIELIDGLMRDIIPNLKYKYNGHEFPLHFVKLGPSEIIKIVVELSSDTDRFGLLRNNWLKEFFVRPSEKDLINKFNNLFWWPAVDGVWVLQCYEVKNTTTHINDLYMLARIGPDEWVGVQTKRCYLNE